ARDHEVVAASRASGVDAMTGRGLAQALAAAEAVVDVTDTRALEGVEPLDFFRTVSRNLAEAEVTAGVRHHVGLSIVGVDRLHSSYFTGKVAKEDTARASSVHRTIIRSTQFSELVERVLQSTAGLDLVRLPPALIQPIAADEVALALADIVEAPA